VSAYRGVLMDMPGITSPLHVISAAYSSTVMRGSVLDIAQRCIWLINPIVPAYTYLRQTPLLTLCLRASTSYPMAN
jgi:hypothetical protein